MNRSDIRAMLLAAALAFGAGSAAAQVTTSAPIPIKPAKRPKVHLATFKGEVVRADSLQMVVRSPGDPRFVRTFTYSPKVKAQIVKILDQGGYQYGDRVVIRYEAGQDVALAIKGKPSRPL